MVTKIKATDFDFDSIKSSFKEFLKNRPEFTDYNFEGSNLNVLFDILAMNTHYQALMANFIANEMFLDTAAKRSSVVSHAKSLGYVPKSDTAATATVDLKFYFTSNSVTNGSSYVLQRGTKLQTSVNNTLYTFTLANSVVGTFTNISGINFYWESLGVKIYEGELTQVSTPFNQSSGKVIIDNLDIDLSTLVVQVSRDNGIDFDTWTYANNVLDLTGDSKVFFVKEGFDLKYEIYFGDNVLGASPADGATVKMTYVVTHGANGNGATQFILNNPDGAVFNGYTQEFIGGTSAGGGYRESTESIRINSLGSFGTQNRAVVPSDYASIARSLSGNIKNILAWGGEENFPPIYNSVFLCVVPNTGEDLLQYDKDYISSELKKKAVGSPTIRFVPPEYLDIAVDLSFTYSTKLISISVFELESNVKNAVGDYAREFLFDFAGGFKMSKFTTYIDRVSDSITSTTADIKLLKKLDIVPRTTQTHIVKFLNPILLDSSTSTITSSPFYTTGASTKCFLVEDKKGLIKIITFDADGKTIVVNDNAGSIDYATGVISFTAYISGYDDTTFKVFMTPKNKNVVSSKNTILRIKSENVKVISKGE